MRAYREGIETAQRSRQGQRINGDSEACSHYGVVVDLICQSDSWSEQLLAGGDTEVVGITADAAEEYVTCREIKAVEFKRTVPSHQRIVFIPQTQCGSEFVGDAIAVADEHSILPFPGCCFDELLALAYADAISGGRTPFARKANFELRSSVELVGCSASIERGHSAAEIKFATR